MIYDAGAPSFKGAVVLQDGRVPAFWPRLQFVRLPVLTNRG